MQDPWMSVKEAADLLGYSEDYFRRLYCDADAPLITIQQRKGPKGQRRIRGVSRVEVEALNEFQTRRPA